MRPLDLPARRLTGAGINFIMDIADSPSLLLNKGRDSLKYSKATNYALHAMLHMVANASSKPVGVQQLAKTLHVSPTYLSKILTSLVKARIIESASGVNGGYRLLAHREEVSFFDVIQAIEGAGSLFDCNLGHPADTCLIQRVMTDAEHMMEQVLKQKKLIDLCADIPGISH